MKRYLTVAQVAFFDLQVLGFELVAVEEDVVFACLGVPRAFSTLQSDCCLGIAKIENKYNKHHVIQRIREVAIYKLKRKYRCFGKSFC